MILNMLTLVEATRADSITIIERVPRPWYVHDRCLWRCTVTKHRGIGEKGARLPWVFDFRTLRDAIDYAGSI